MHIKQYICTEDHKLGSRSTQEHIHWLCRYHYHRISPPSPCFVEGSFAAPFIWIVEAFHPKRHRGERINPWLQRGSLWWVFTWEQSCLGLKRKNERQKLYQTWGLAFEERRSGIIWAETGLEKVHRGKWNQQCRNHHKRLWTSNSTHPPTACVHTIYNGKLQTFTRST